MTLITIVHSEQ